MENYTTQMRTECRASIRSSGIELMRIVCMLVIVMGHYSTHGGVVSYLSVDTMSAAGVFLQLFGMGNRIACSMFAMITGYFKIVSHSKHHYRKIVPLVLEMMLYSVLLYIVTPSQYRGDYALFKSLLPILYGNWFVVNYIIFYLFIPFISPMLLRLHKDQYKQLLATVFVAWSLIPTITGRAWHFSSFDFFLVMYCIGAYVRLYSADIDTYQNTENLKIGLFFLTLVGVSILSIDVLAVCMESNALLSHARYFTEYNSVLAVPCAVFFFLYFVRLSFHSSVVNFIAKSSLGVLLIHDNACFNDVLWTVISPNQAFAAFPYVHAIIKTLAVYVICILVDIIRRGTIGWYIEQAVLHNSTSA